MPCFSSIQFKVYCHNHNTEAQLHQYIRNNKIFFVTVKFCNLSSVIVRVSAVLKRTSCHLQSQCDIVPSVDGIYVSGY